MSYSSSCYGVSAYGAAVLLYETGKKSGEKWINRFSKEWKLKDNKFIEAVQNFYAELGWGKFDIKENNGKELIIRVENSFIARGYGKSNAALFIHHNISGTDKTSTCEQISRNRFWS